MTDCTPTIDITENTTNVTVTLPPANGVSVTLSPSSSVAVTSMAIGVTEEQPPDIAVDTTVAAPNSVVISTAGGVQGPPGPANDIFTRVAAIDLSGQRVVTPLSDGTVTYADSTVIADSTKPLWLTLDAALAGDEVNVLAFGLVSEGSWSWIPGDPIFLGPNGVLTQTSPTAGAGDAFMAPVASPDTTTDVFYNPRTPIAFV